MDNLPEEPNAMDFMVQIVPDISIVENIGNDHYTLWHFSLQYRVAFQYWSYSHNGAQSHWTLSQKYGVQELPNGLCFWDVNGQQWMLFSKQVQETYTGYVAEKEIFNE